jgi:hypothetical protein
MRRVVFITGLLLISLLMLGPNSPPAAAQSVSCRSASYLSDARSVTGSHSTCYKFTVPRNQALLQITLESNSGATDLFVREGTVYSLTTDDKVTVSASTGQATYVVHNPSATTYTIAAVPSSSRGSFRLTATTTSTSWDQPSLNCSQNSCAATFTLGSSIKLGSSYGDQLIFPVVIGSTGRVSARASWSGTASDLALELYGPSLYSANPTTSYAAISGRSPQSLSYNVTSSDLQRSANWQVTLVNDNRAGGSIRNGSLVITYPRQPPTLYLAPIRGYYYVAPK